MVDIKKYRKMYIKLVLFVQREILPDMEKIKHSFVFCGSKLPNH